MIMTKQDTVLSQQADHVFATLVALGPGWHGRPEIARQMGKSRLQAVEAMALDLLIMQGRIEAERHEINAPIRERWEYRVKE
jgi:hypothetical protein